jgi:hypothetical protein
MGIEQDVPIARGQLRALVIGLVTLSAIGAALFGGFIPGIHLNPSEPATMVVDGEPYYYATWTLSLPSLFANSSLPSVTVFHNVTFAAWFVHWNWVSGALVQGNGTEANGTVYPFLLGTGGFPPQNQTLFLSPDRLFGAFWPGLAQSGSSVRLLVHA